MTTEKTPTLYATKAPFENDEKKDKFCSRTVLTCVLTTFMVVIMVIFTVEFLYPTFEDKLKFDEDHLHISEENPLEVTVAISRKITSDGQKPTTTNPWDFEFLIDPSNLCQTLNPPNSYRYEQDPEVKLLMLVPSAVDHFEQRRAIRNTWGSIAEKPLGPLRLGFVLGISDNMTINDQIREESSDYKDIIQADFVDSYDHLTTKSVLMLKWVAKRCPHAQYFLKSDDDTFVNVGIIADILRSEPFISTNKFIGGYVYTGAQPRGIPPKKHYSSESDHPYDEYMPYASGSAYVMTGPTALDLFDASKVVEPFLQEENVFLTGLCADRIDAPRFHDPRFRIDNPSPPSWDSFSSLATVHQVTPDILEEVWNDMTQTVLSQLFNQEAAVNSTVLLRKKRNL